MQHCQLIQTQDLQAVIGDASRLGVNGAQYAGVWSLTSRHRAFNAFGNSFAGLIPGEIRGRAPELHVVDESTVVLRRKADSEYASSTEAIYRVRAPYYLDHDLTIADAKDLRVMESSTPYREVNWCNYMNSADDPFIYFRSEGEWVRYMSPVHGVGSVLAPSYLRDEELETPPIQRLMNRYIQPFHVNRASVRFDEPFYYGRIGHMVMILIFDTPRWLRFFLSPTGGGSAVEVGKSYPAWDFEWLIPGNVYDPTMKYTFRTRLVYKPFVSETDVLEEVKRAQGDLGFASR